jgi:putative tryptophan/tyrosine transport system substrate-binding protein
MMTTESMMVRVKLAPMFAARLCTTALSASMRLRRNVEAGGLMSYRPNWLDLFRRATGLVDKLLRGAIQQTFP